MSKKGENIYKRKDGRWEGRYIRGRDDSGKIIYGSIYGKKYSEVKQKLTVFKAKYHEYSGTHINFYTGTFEEWVRFWLNTEVRNSVKITTYSSYSRLISKHIIPSIGHYPLRNIQAKHLQTFVYALQDRKLSSGSIKNIFNIVKMSMKSAKKNGFILENHWLYVQLPKLEKKELTVLTREQQKRLVQVSMREEDCSPVILSLYSGMRIGEISGLKWEDIDFELDLIHVKRTVSRIINENSLTQKTRLIEGAPKSICSNRQIPLSKRLKEYLLLKKKETIYVIESGNGVTDPRTITNRFKKNLNAAGLVDINFHILRHTFATRCLENNVDVASLSKILGHQSIKMTLDTYANSLMETRRLAIATLDNLF